MRTEQQIAEGYKRFRGRCLELCEALRAQDPTLTLVRGHIFVAHWPSDSRRPHWWLRRLDGAIVDPSWEQFPFQNAPSTELYEEFNGVVACAECGKEILETDADIDGNYAFCSYRCHGRFVGVF